MALAPWWRWSSPRRCGGLSRAARRTSGPPSCSRRSGSAGSRCSPARCTWTGWPTPRTGSAPASPAARRWRSCARATSDPSAWRPWCWCCWSRSRPRPSCSPRPRRPGLVAAAVVLSRLVLPLACLLPAARADGLGSLVAGAATWPQVLVRDGRVPCSCVSPGHGRGRACCSVLAGLARRGGASARWCVRRLGGITGDVLGACVEVTFTAALLAMALPSA